MSKRHVLHVGDWESIFGRLQELVLANSGEDEFEEIFKLMVAKLWDEICEKPRRFRRRETPEVTAEAINTLIAKASDRWQGIIQGTPKSRLRPEHVQVCIEAVQNLDLSDSKLEVLDNLFEHLISHSAKSSKGQYFTPRHVIDCCVKIADPSPDDVIIDPASGSAGFLIHALQHVREQNSSVEAADYAANKLWGCDYDARAVQVAKALMLIAGAEQSNIFRLNSLLTPRSNRSLFSAASPEEDKSRLTIEDVVRSQFKNFDGFDLILTNPPFAGEIRETNILHAYELGQDRERIERDILFVERCVDLLRPGGRLCMVLPHNKFGSKNWKSVRRWLLRHVRVVSVLSLGRHTFLPHTHQKTSILFGIKRKKPLSRTDYPEEDILFSISQRAGKDSTGKIIPKNGAKPDEPDWIQADHDLSEVVPVFHEFVENKSIPWKN